MTPEQTDFIKFVILFAAARVNPAAVFILLLHAISVVLLHFVNQSPVGIYCLICALYCVSSTTEIIVSSKIRYILFAIGVLHFGAAIEFYLFDYQTIFYRAFPAAVNALDMIILILLLTGGRGFVGLHYQYYIRSRCTSFNNRYLRYNRDYQRQTTASNVKK